MSKMIQIRNVPDALHRKLKSRAALAGMSLSDYLLAEARQSTERPTPQEFRERLALLEPVSTKTSTVEILREARDHR